MKSSDISSLKKNDVAYKKQAIELEKSYKCAWDDEIHDSFARHLKLVKDRSNNIHEITIKTEQIITEIENTNIDALIRKADNLCREVDLI